MNILQIPKMPNVDTFKFTEMKQRIFEQLDSYRWTAVFEEFKVNWFSFSVGFRLPCSACVSF